MVEAAEAPVMRTPERYNLVAAWLHWVIAALILFNLVLGFLMEDFPPSAKFIVMGLHISAGITVLLLTVIRIAWRLTYDPPQHDPPLKTWEKHASHFAHFLLYAAMVLMPLTGWATVSAHAPPGSEGQKAEIAALPPPPPGVVRKPEDFQLKWWFVLPLPTISVIENVGTHPEGLPAQKELHDEFAEWHEVGAYLLIALLFLHLGGAVKHQFLDGSREFARMSVFREPNSKS